MAPSSSLVQDACFSSIKPGFKSRWGHIKNMDKKDYLDISRASDIKNSGDRKLYRIFEMIPGVLSLGTLFGVLILSWLFPSYVAIFIICFCFYYLYHLLQLDLFLVPYQLLLHQYLSYLGY